MVQSSHYPDERQSRRILELSYPEVDADVRENLAYLVSARRMTLDDALAELAEAEGSAECSTGKKAGIIYEKSTVNTVKGPTRSPASTSYRNTSSTGTTATSTSQRSGNTGGPSTTGERYERRYSTTTKQTPVTAEARVRNRASNGPEGDIHEEAKTGYRRGDVPHIKTSLAVDATPKRLTGASLPSPSRGAAPPMSASPTKDTTTSTAASPAGEDDHYRRSRYTRNKSDTRVSRSDSELTEMRESARSLVRSEEESQQRSAPDVLAAKSSGRTGGGQSSTVRKMYTSASTRAAGVRSENEDGTAQTAADAVEVCVARKEEAWAEANNDTDEPMFTDTKLITDEEKAVYEEKMQGMMHYWYRDETSMYDYTLRSLPAGQVLFFTTSMTGDRGVRDHCRLMENLLYLKLIPHHTIDVADNEFFLRRVRKMYTHATKKRVMPEMPLLFVDDTLIGDFTTVQELEDAGELDAKLLEARCSVLRPRVVAECEAKQLGLPGAPLVLPTQPPKTALAKASPRVVGAPTEVRSVATPTAARLRPPTVATAETTVEAVSTRRRGSEEAHPVLSPLKQHSNAYETASKSTRPPPTRNPPTKTSNANLPSSSSSATHENHVAHAISGPTRGYGARRNGAGAADAAPPSTCLFSHGRRLDRTSVVAGDAPQEEATKSASSPVPSAGRSVRASTRTELGRNVGSGRMSLAGGAEKPSTASAVPRLPSLTARNGDGYADELTSPSARGGNQRRYTTQPRATAAAAAGSRTGLC